MAASLSTELGLQTYLESCSIEHEHIRLLTGGTANYVYRVSFRDGRTVIYKHAAPYLHSNAEFAFDPTRMDYEAKALEMVPPLLSKESPPPKAHAVNLHSYAQSEKLLCLEDGGDYNLKDAYRDPNLDIPTIGKELGQWIAALHRSSTKTPLSLSDNQDLRANNPIGVTIYRHSYMNLSSALSQFGHDTSLGDRINEEYGSRLATDNECICHGDFWPGNVLVKSDGRSDAKLTIVDWEMVRRGTSATDIGQFAAEAFLLDRFRGGKGLLPAFLNAYAVARQSSEVVIGRDWVLRMAIHWAVHVAFWPTRVEWTDSKGTQQLVDIGVKTLKAAVSADWAELRASELFRDVGEAWSPIWDRS